MTYWHYYSTGELIPNVDFDLLRIVPEVYYCNGECFYEVSISSGGEVVASGSSSGVTQEELEIPLTATLEAGERYVIYQHVWTTMSVGIYTAGDADPIIHHFGTFSPTDAHSNSWDHLDRGTQAFTLIQACE